MFIFLLGLAYFHLTVSLHKFAHLRTRIIYIYSLTSSHLLFYKNKLVYMNNQFLKCNFSKNNSMLYYHIKHEIILYLEYES